MLPNHENRFREHSGTLGHTKMNPNDTFGDSPDIRRERSRDREIQRQWATGYTRWIDGHREMEEDGMVIEAGFTVVATLLNGSTPSR